MKLLIVDDEPPARARLRRMLADLPGVATVLEAADGAQALALAEEAQPDAAILDIQMPGQSGLELALALPTHMACAFNTAFDDYAVQAFELNAVDYLLKPYDQSRLAATVQRLQQRLNRPPPAPRSGLLSALQALQPVAGHWLVPQRSGSLLKLPLAQVAWVAAADNYIELHAPPACHLSRHTLADFLAHAAGAGFVRVHRSHAVNPAHIAQVASLPRGEAELTLRSGQTLRVSRGFRGSIGAAV
ncbi:LytR/AlgR family response regulator transcription factor [Ideonella sp.]|uniref:LytR/AlgR family response regulator transcription factor n=1 Tax=Ideonella sp. TaxID=1929293 RepID=UPI003BB63F21